MHMSRPIEVEGRLPGVLLIQAAACRVAATRPAIGMIKGTICLSPEEARHAAGLAPLHGRPPASAAGAW